MDYKFGTLFYNDTYRGDSMLLKSTLTEIAEHLGHTLENPISISLLCLEIAMPLEAFELIYVDILKISNGNDNIKLKDLSFIRKIMESHFPEAKHYGTLTINGFMKALIRCKAPELSYILDDLGESPFKSG